MQGAPSLRRLSQEHCCQIHRVEVLKPGFDFRGELKDLLGKGSHAPHRGGAGGKDPLHGLVKEEGESARS